MSGIRIFIGAAAMTASLLLPQMAGAQSAARDGVAYQAIRDQNWSLAEQELLAGLQKNPGNVFGQLNLAWVYAQTGRKDAAAAIYQKILTSNETRLSALPSGKGMPVKTLAERGLTLLARQ